MYELLNVPRGMTAIIGSGGKTTLMYALARELPGIVIVGTTTKIYRPLHLPVFTGENLAEISAALRANKAVCVGSIADHGKLGAPLCPMESLREFCDFLIVEADGSRGLPLKAHLPHEPVIPPGCGKTILIAGLSGLGRPISEAAHRPERFAELCGKAVCAPVTPEDIAAVILAEGVPDTVILNQADTEDHAAAARRIAGLLPCPVLFGSLQNDSLSLL